MGDERADCSLIGTTALLAACPDALAHTFDMPDSSSVVVQVAAYRSALLAMHEVRSLERGARQWNRLVKQMQRAHLLLRESAEGRTAISNLMNDDCLTVREWSATNALAWDAKRAKAVLKELASQEGGLASLDASMTLREFRAGRLRTDWQP
jgi:hypothetical protein